MVKKGSTFILKLSVFAIGLIVLALCIFALPSAWKNGPLEFPGTNFIFHIIVVGMYIAAIPFYILLWQTLKLLSYIDKNIAFSQLSVEALRKIKYCAFVIGALYISGTPLLLPIAEIDDAPGLLPIGLAFACVPIVVGVFAAVLEKLLQNAIDMKSENDLTV